MTISDKILIFSWGISGFIGIIIGIIGIIYSNNKENVEHSYGLILVSLTSGILLISYSIIAFGIVYIIFYPLLIISKIKNLE